MKEIVFDTETNGFLPECTKMHIINIQEANTGEKVYFLEGDEGWRDVLDNVEIISAHNLCGYDLLVLEKLFNYKLPSHVRQRDTLILSKVLDYHRFGPRGHGLDVWGEMLGYPKLEYNQWEFYTPEMHTYCDRDVLINYKVYRLLIQELMESLERHPNLATYIKAEQAISRWSAIAYWKGWSFDVPKGHKLFGELCSEMEKITSALEPRLGTKVVVPDKVPHTGGGRPWQPALKPLQSYPTTPKWTKNGNYHSHLAKYLDVDPSWGYLGLDMEEKTPEELKTAHIAVGDFSKISIEKRGLASNTDVKEFLYEHGWVPDTWNFKTEGRRKIKTSPKITEESLELMGEGGQMYLDYLSAASRRGILKTWLEQSHEGARVHGECITIGTPTLRARHKVIVNVPSADSPWGQEMRELFTSDPGWVLVGCDSAGNQARGLAHYLNDPEFTNILLNDDIHLYNARALEAVLKSMQIDWDDYLMEAGVAADEAHTLEENLTARKRSSAKRILYAFLFGAAGGTLWSYIFGVAHAGKGQTLKEGFIKAVPGFSDLLDKLNSEWARNKVRGGYITSISGARVYVDSGHKLLVSLLQACEKATCAAACLLLMKWLEEESIEYVPLIFMHDELDFMTRAEDAERAKALGVKAFQEGPKLFGVTIMDGDGKIGENWYDIH